MLPHTRTVHATVLRKAGEPFESELVRPSPPRFDEVVVAAAFVPQLVALYLQGRVPFDRLVKLYNFSGINQAADASLDGSVIKPTLRIAEPN